MINLSRKIHRSLWIGRFFVQKAVRICWDPSNNISIKLRSIGDQPHQLLIKGVSGDRNSFFYFKYFYPR